MATNTRARLTYQDYFDLPESDDRYELIDGELFMVPAPVPEHQDFLGELYVVIRAFVKENGLGRVFFAPLDVVLSEVDVFQPDLIFVSKERLNIITGQNVRGAPDLVVEVLSPSTAQLDRTTKRERYARFGVREYWLADINARTVEVNVFEGEVFSVAGVYGEGDMLESKVLKNLKVDISGLFEAARI